MAEVDQKILARFYNLRRTISTNCRRRSILTIGLIVCAFCDLATGQTVKNETTCLTSGNKKVPCTCGPGEMIHIVSKLYQNASADCRPIPGGCQLLQKNLSDGLLPECSGKQTCDEFVSDFRMKKKCENITAMFVTVAYECISDKPTNICDLTALMTNTLYLTTPGYPDYDYLTNTETCVCDARGTNMSVEILEIRFTPDINSGANLTLTGDFSPWILTTPFVYNTIPVTRASNLSVVFDSRGRKGNILWIKVKGTSNITVICNTETTVVPFVTTTITPVTRTTALSFRIASTAMTSIMNSSTDVTSTTPSVTSTTPSVNLQNSSSTAVIGALCAVIVCLLVVVVTLVIYFKYRLSTLESTTENTDLHYEDIAGMGNPVMDFSQDGDISDNRQVDYSDMRHYGNMDNVYIGLTEYVSAPEPVAETGNSYTHLHTYANDEDKHHFSELEKG